MGTVYLEAVSGHKPRHADPTCARHGVLKGQIDISARVIWLAEKIGWLYDVRWRDEARLISKRVRGSRKLGSMAKRAAAKLVGRYPGGPP